MEYRRIDDHLLGLVGSGTMQDLEERFASERSHPPMEMLGYTFGPDLQPVPLRDPGEEPSEVLLLLGAQADEAMLVAGAAVRRLPRGQGREDLLARAAAGAAAWRRERLRTWRRAHLPEKLIAFFEHLHRAESVEEVCQIVAEHTVRIVGGYTAMVLVRQGSGPLHLVAAFPSDLGTGDLSLPWHPRMHRSGMILAEEARADTGAPFGSLAPLFADTRAQGIAHAPFGERGVILLTERRDTRTFEADDWDLLRMLGRQAETRLQHLELIARERSLSLTDPLTGLANRRQMQVVLKHAWAAAQRGDPLTVAMLDLDDFKTINDQQGHSTGDWILRMVSDCLRQEARGTDLVVRYGGDEFLVVFPRETATGARAFMARVRKRLAGRVGVSVGIASYEPGYASYEELIQEADRMLYEAKHRHRSGHRED